MDFICTMQPHLVHSSTHINVFSYFRRSTRCYEPLRIIFYFFVFNQFHVIFLNFFCCYFCWFLSLLKFLLYSLNNNWVIRNDTYIVERKVQCTIQRKAKEHMLKTHLYNEYIKKVKVRLIAVLPVSYYKLNQ